MAVGVDPAALRYTASNLWVSAGDGKARIGLAAAAGLADATVRDVALAAPGARLDWGTVFGWLETREPGLVRLLAPVRGTVMAINQRLLTEPYLLARDPYGAGWLLDLSLSDPADLEVLLSSDAYRKLVERSEPARALPAHLQQGAEPVLLIDSSRRVVAANLLAQAEFGATGRQLAHGVTCRELLGCCQADGRLLPDSHCPVLTSLDSGEPMSRGCQVVSARGERRQVECEVTPSSTHTRLAVMVLRPVSGSLEVSE